ncbi:ferritin heavy chain B-like [Heterodontus francisci]|uniref:ferritin heavy chain B-like n=1 Tax=Heterodontus francisci TaxID=7792 RepID=UPI00355ADC34
MASQVCQNYHKDCEDAVNKQINLELYSSYVYLSMSYYFDRDDVALRHFAEFFKEQSHGEREHAEKLMKFQNKRGGRIIFENIKKPEQDEWSNGLEAMQRALQMEKDVNQSLLDLHKLSTGNTDPHLCDFLETHYLDEQVKMIKKLGDHITNLKRLGAPDNGMGEYLFDKHTLSKIFPCNQVSIDFSFAEATTQDFTTLKFHGLDLHVALRRSNRVLFEALHFSFPQQVSCFADSLECFRLFHVSSLLIYCGQHWYHIHSRPIKRSVNSPRDGSNCAQHKINFYLQTPAIMLTNSESENRFTLRKLKEANIKYITDKILLKRLGKMEAHGIAGNLYMWS